MPFQSFWFCEEKIKNKRIKGKDFRSKDLSFHSNLEILTCCQCFVHHQASFRAFLFIKVFVWSGFITTYKILQKIEAPLFATKGSKPHNHEIFSFQHINKCISRPTWVGLQKELLNTVLSLQSAFGHLKCFKNSDSAN